MAQFLACSVPPFLSQAGTGPSSKRVTHLGLGLVKSMSPVKEPRGHNRVHLHIYLSEAHPVPGSMGGTGAG